MIRSRTYRRIQLLYVLNLLLIRAVIFMPFAAKQPYYFANQPTKAIWLTDREAFCVQHRMFTQSGLDLDIYMSLIDSNYPID